MTSAGDIAHEPDICIRTNANTLSFSLARYNVASQTTLILFYEFRWPFGRRATKTHGTPVFQQAGTHTYYSTLGTSTSPSPLCPLPTPLHTHTPPPSSPPTHTLMRHKKRSVTVTTKTRASLTTPPTNTTTTPNNKPPTNNYPPA